MSSIWSHFDPLEGFAVLLCLWRFVCVASSVSSSFGVLCFYQLNGSPSPEVPMKICYWHPSKLFDRKAPPVDWSHWVLRCNKNHFFFFFGGGNCCFEKGCWNFKVWIFSRRNWREHERDPWVFQQKGGAVSWICDGMEETRNSMAIPMLFLGIQHPTFCRVSALPHSGSSQC